MTVKELIETLKTCDEKRLRKAGSNRAGFIKFND